MIRFLVLQHLDIEPPLLIGDTLEQLGGCLSVARPDQGEALPAVSDVDGVIIMGGPQSANDNSDYIQAELVWLKDAIATGMPMLGVCLGAQLMAKAAGAEIVAAPVRELGWFPVYRTAYSDEDPLFGSMPDGMRVFQWHGETFTRIDAMQLVATHPDVPAQAFRLGCGQYGLQFHVEINAAIIDQWIASGESEREHLGIDGIRQLHSDTPLHLEAMQQFCRQMVQHWLGVIRS